MKTRQLFLLLIAGLLMFPLFQAVADPPVTFDLLLSFDYPGADQSNAFAINDRGDVVGTFFLDSGTTRGFVRFSDGHFGAPVVEPNDTGGFTVLAGINNVGAVCGFYSASGSYRGFLWSDSVYTEVPMNADNTVVEKVNDAGNFCGYTINPSQAFVSIDGTVSSFKIPGADNTSAYGINNLNQVVGSYYLSGRAYGFRRDVDGTLTYPIAVTTAPGTLLFDVNDKGQMVGSIFTLAGGHGIFFRSPTEYALYGYPGATHTVFQGINTQGDICGTWQDAAGAHSFIVRVRSAAGE